MPTSIEFFKADIKFRFSKRNLLIKWIQKVIKKEGKLCGTISFIFCSDTFLLDLNQKFLKHDYYTDIITFDNSIAKTINGEIYISIDRVKENSSSLGIKFKDELYRVIIHGVLHLIGYKDHTPAQKKLMRKKEDATLSLLHSFT